MLGGAVVKKVDVDAVPQVGGQSLLDYDLEAADKPWRLPGNTGIGQAGTETTPYLFCAFLFFFLAQVRTCLTISTMASQRRRGNCTVRSSAR